MDVKYHNTVFFSIKNTEEFSCGWWLWGLVAMGLQMEEFWKKDRSITISEHKEYFNESYAEWYL